jgi:hypothetical protein
VRWDAGTRNAIFHWHETHYIRCLSQLCAEEAPPEEAGHTYAFFLAGRQPYNVCMLPHKLCTTVGAVKKYTGQKEPSPIVCTSDSASHVRAEECSLNRRPLCKARQNRAVYKYCGLQCQLLSRNCAIKKVCSNNGPLSCDCSNPLEAAS